MTWKIIRMSIYQKDRQYCTGPWLAAWFQRRSSVCERKWSLLLNLRGGGSNTDNSSQPRLARSLEHGTRHLEVAGSKPALLWTNLGVYCDTETPAAKILAWYRWMYSVVVLLLSLEPHDRGVASFRWMYSSVEEVLGVVVENECPIWASDSKCVVGWQWWGWRSHSNHSCFNSLSHRPPPSS